MKTLDFLILGGGIAGTTAAETIRSKDSTSSITILTEEPTRLYSRVLLPHYLRNENSLESVFVRTQESYSEKNIDLKTSTRVTRVNTKNKNVETSGGESFTYKKLLITTGGKVNKLGVNGGNLPEVVYLRTLEDAKKIKEFFAQSKEAVVLGGGFISIELAQSFVKNGLKTTAVIRGKSFWDHVVGGASGEFLSKILSENGVSILTEKEVNEFNGTDKLTSVKLANGEELKADLAGVGIGIHMDLAHLEDSGLKINKGVLTNEYLETSEPDVWAAGDIAEFYDTTFSKIHQLGNWANASAQGRLVGANMVGEKKSFETASMYSINIFDSNFSLLGDISIDQNTEIIERGSIGSKKLARILLREDVIVGASLINMPLERNILTRLIKNKTKVTASKSKLSDSTFDLNIIS